MKIQARASLMRGSAQGSVRGRGPLGWAVKPRSVGGLIAGRRGARAFGGLRLLATTTVGDLGLRATATAAATLAVTRSELLAALHAFDDRVADALRDELDRADRVVVAGDDVVDEVR